MHINPTYEPKPEVPADERILAEREKLVRKLRWIGLQQDAERIQAELKFAVPPEPDTD